MNQSTNMKSHEVTSVSPVVENSATTSQSVEVGQSLQDVATVAIAKPISVRLQAISVTDAIVTLLEELGIEYAFGVVGGAMASLWASLSNSRKIQLLHFRHEGGAAFAAAEAYFASDRPVVLFTTAGPGITNALTGLFAARGEGAKVIFLSACTSAAQRGRWAIQETSTYTMPHADLFTSGSLFHYAVTLETPEELPQVARRLALGLARPGGFIAHISIPTGVQSSAVKAPLLSEVTLPQLQMVPSEKTIANCAQILSENPFAIWIGFGARKASKAILQLAERTGVAVMCSPRGKGIFPEDHRQFVGVTGLGGHESVLTFMQQQRPTHILVLGTRLGEPTSFWSPTMIPSGGFLHVDIDPDVPGVAYPSVKTLPIQSDINVFVNALLEYFPSYPDRALALPHPTIPVVPSSDDNECVRPEVLMDAIQRTIVEGSDAVVLAESGNSFTWATHRLRFNQSERYRVSTGVGSMGHTATGVIGTAQGRQGKAVAIVGDGSMLMNNEISTAVKYQVPAVWIILNDSRYGMCDQGMKMLGLEGPDAAIPQTDFVAIAIGMGADGIRVNRESDLEAALIQAMTATGPFVVDAIIDPTRLTPSKGRNQGLLKQGVQPSPIAPKQISFPLV